MYISLNKILIEPALVDMLKNSQSLNSTVGTNFIQSTNYTFDNR